MAKHTLAVTLAACWIPSSTRPGLHPGWHLYTDAHSLLDTIQLKSWTAFCIGTCTLSAQPAGYHPARTTGLHLVLVPTHCCPATWTPSSTRPGLHPVQHLAHCCILPAGYHPAQVIGSIIHRYLHTICAACWIPSSTHHWIAHSPGTHTLLPSNLDTIQHIPRLHPVWHLHTVAYWPICPGERLRVTPYCTQTLSC